MYNKFFYNNNRELRSIWVILLFFGLLPFILLFYLVAIIQNSIAAKREKKEIA